MLGNTILCNAGAKGRLLEGTVGPGNMWPGIKVQVQSAVSPVGGRMSYVPYQPASNDLPREMLILLDDPYQGFTPGVKYVTGTRCFIYSPLSGDEMNILVTPEAGTGSANAFFIGDRLQPVAGTGMYDKVGPTSDADFKVLEHIDTNVGLPTLVYCMKA